MSELSQAFSTDFRLIPDHTAARILAATLDDIFGGYDFDRPAIDARVRDYWNAKHGFGLQAKAEQQTRIVEASIAGMAKKKRRQEITGAPIKPLPRLTTGDIVTHVASGRTFIVIEDQGESVAVKSDNVPRMVFLRTSLVKPT